MGKLTQDQTILRGRLAEDLLDNQLLEDAFEEITLNTFTTFMGTDSNADDERTKLWAIGQALVQLKGVLDAYVGEAQVEKHNREYDNEKDKVAANG